MAVTEQSATAASFGADDGLLKLVTETSILSGDLSCSIRLRKCHGSPRHRSPGRDDLFLQLSNLPFAERIFIISLFIEYRLGWETRISTMTRSYHLLFQLQLSPPFPTIPCTASSCLSQDSRSGQVEIKGTGIVRRHWQSRRHLIHLEPL